MAKIKVTRGETAASDNADEIERNSKRREKEFAHVLETREIDFGMEAVDDDIEKQLRQFKRHGDKDLKREMAKAALLFDDSDDDE